MEYQIEMHIDLKKKKKLSTIYNVCSVTLRERNVNSPMSTGSVQRELGVKCFLFSRFLVPTLVYVLNRVLLVRFIFHFLGVRRSSLR